MAQLRRELRRLLLPGERRVHFQSEGDGPRRQLLTELLNVGATCRLYTGNGKPEMVCAACLRALVGDFKDGRLQRLVLESRVDRHTLANVIQRDAAGRSLIRHEHLAPDEHPALWIPDAIAWCHDTGGTWRQRCQPLVEEFTDLGTI